jgi:hypothetical protein
VLLYQRYKPSFSQEEEVEVMVTEEEEELEVSGLMPQLLLLELTQLLSVMVEQLLQMVRTQYSEVSLQSEVDKEVLTEEQQVKLEVLEEVQLQALFHSV